MALISCSECGHKVSDKASACPSCGNPLGEPATSASPVTARTSGASRIAVEPPVQTIEQTGKQYKGAQLLRGIAMVLGVVLVTTHAEALGAVLLAGGLIAYIYGRFGAWWHHA